MFKRLVGFCLGALVALALCAPVATNATTLKWTKVDCSSVADWMDHNGENVVALVKSIVPIALAPPVAQRVDVSESLSAFGPIGNGVAQVIGFISTLFPQLKPGLDMQWVGVAIQVSRVFLQFGGSPAGAVNLVTEAVLCHGFVPVEPIVAASAASAF
jgi:hypothetical protein